MLCYTRISISDLWLVPGVVSWFVAGAGARGFPGALFVSKRNRVQWRVGGSEWLVVVFRFAFRAVFVPAFVDVSHSQTHTQDKGMYLLQL